MFESIKTKLARRRLAKMQCGDSRCVKACGLALANKVGIIYDATEAFQFEAVRKFLFELKNRIPYVKALGFVDSEELSDFHLQPLDFYFFCKKDLDWQGVPRDESVAEFCNTDYDILICLDMDEKIPLSYVKMRTNAGFLVGYYTETNSDLLDVMISLDEENSNIVELIKQIKYYLENIR